MSNKENVVFKGNTYTFTGVTRLTGLTTYIPVPGIGRIKFAEVEVSACDVDKNICALFYWVAQSQLDYHNGEVYEIELVEPYRVVEAGVDQGKLNKCHDKLVKSFITLAEQIQLIKDAGGMVDEQFAYSLEVAIHLAKDDEDAIEMTQALQFAIEKL